MTGTAKINFDLSGLSKDQGKKHIIALNYIQRLSSTPSRELHKERSICLQLHNQIPLNYINLHTQKILVI